MKTHLKPCQSADARRGSTLLIVLSLLGILVFLGMVFYTIATQEKAAAENFSEAAKDFVDVPDDPFPHAMRHLIVGPRANESRSILSGPGNRHSVTSTLVGRDTAPYTGRGYTVIANPVAGALNGLPGIDQNEDGIVDTPPADPWQNPLNVVDSLAAWGDVSPWHGSTVNEGELRSARSAFEESDVSYTYPNINNMFVALRGWAIRDNGAGITDQTLRYERVPVIVPTFFRPSILKSNNANSAGGQNVLTDFDWYDESAHPEFSTRSMRPSPLHTCLLYTSPSPRDS